MPKWIPFASVNPLDEKLAELGFVGSMPQCLYDPLNAGDLLGQRLSVFANQVDVIAGPRRIPLVDGNVCERTLKADDQRRPSIREFTTLNVV